MIQKSHNVKLEDQWFGPYRIREIGDSGYYRLDELDGTELRDAFAGNRIKRFIAGREVGREATQLSDNSEASDDDEGVDEDEENPTS
jgi:hypothetical protein